MTSSRAAKAALAVPGRVFRNAVRWVGGLLRGPVLTPQQCERFRREGYLIFDPQLPPALLDRARVELDGKFPRRPADAPGFPLHGRIQDGWKFSPAVKALALAPRVLAALGELYGREPLPFQTLNFPVGTEQKTHSDTIHFNSKPSGWMCGVWIALEDIDLDNGPLEYYPASHKLPEYTMADVGVPAAPGSDVPYRDYERFIAGMIEREGLQPNYGTMKKGQAFIWASNLLHGGGMRRDRKRSRHSQVTHYFFPGCSYYTPLLSSGEIIAWRDPEWIR